MKNHPLNIQRRRLISLAIFCFMLNLTVGLYINSQLIDALVDKRVTFLFSVATATIGIKDAVTIILFILLFGLAWAFLKIAGVEIDYQDLYEPMFWFILVACLNEIIRFFMAFSVLKPIMHNLLFTNYKEYLSFLKIRFPHTLWIKYERILDNSFIITGPLIFGIIFFIRNKKKYSWQDCLISGLGLALGLGLAQLV